MTPHRRGPLRIALTLALVLAASPLRAAEVDPLIPPDSEMVITVNVRHILDSELVKGLGLDQVKGLLENVEGVGDVLKDLGFDPFKDLDSVVIASPGGTAGDRGLAIIRGKFNLAKFAKKAEETLKENGEVFKRHKVPNGSGGRFTLYEIVLQENESSLFVSMAGKDLLLASPGKDYVVEAMKRALARKKAVLKNKDFQAMLRKMQPKQSISLAMMGKAIRGDRVDEAPGMIRAALKKIEAIGGGVTLGKETVKYQLVVSTKTDKDAKDLSGTAKRALGLATGGLLLLGGDSKLLNALADVLKGIRVSSKDKVVAFKGVVTSDTIKELLGKSDD
jgi:hypothetical protein